MSNNKKSSVNLLITVLGNYDDELLFLFREQIKQAKEMHKEEITQAWKKGDGQFDNCAKEMSLEYYNETFGGNNGQQ